MEHYKEIELSAGCTIEEAVNELLYYKNKGIKVYGDFNGHKLYSDIVTIDSAYKEITGYTKEEYDAQNKKRIEAFQKQFEEDKEKAIQKIPFWIEEGEKLFSKDKLCRWKEIVPIRANDLYHGFELDCILEIEKILNKKTKTSFLHAKKIFERQGHSGISYRLVYILIKEFCTDGDEFAKYLDENSN